MLLRAYRDALGDVAQCPKEYKPFYERDAKQFFASGEYEFWAELAGTRLSTRK
ncbi:MAG TPA: hypothetical protein GXX39_00570 [Syntrophothermus lipocalidus]|nr:hypothetical protein [Syntrophothermus lipocalidus]